MKVIEIHWNTENCGCDTIFNTNKNEEGKILNWKCPLLIFLFSWVPKSENNFPVHFVLCSRISKICSRIILKTLKNTEKHSSMYWYAYRFINFQYHKIMKFQFQFKAILYINILRILLMFFIFWKQNSIHLILSQYTQYALKLWI